MLRLTERDVKACAVPSLTFRQGHHQPSGPAGGGAVPPRQDRVGRGRGSQKRHEAPGLGQSHREKGSLRGIRALPLLKLMFLFPSVNVCKSVVICLQTHIQKIATTPCGLLADSWQNRLSSTTIKQWLSNAIISVVTSSMDFARGVQTFSVWVEWDNVKRRASQHRWDWVDVGRLLGWPSDGSGH